MRRLVLVLVLLTSSMTLPARAAEQGLGFTAGLSGGLGTHYRRMGDGAWGWGGTAALWSAGPEIAYSAGLQLLRTLSENRYGRLYGVAALGVTQTYLQPGMPAILALGSGLGLQLGKGPGPTLSFEGQMTLFGNGVQGWALAPLPALSLIYYY